MLRKILSFALLIMLGCAPGVLKTGEGEAPGIQVIYPKKNQKIGAVDSTFILGNVTPGAKLHINNYRVAVHERGGFIAFLPIDTGQFIFSLKAENEYGENILEWPVEVPTPFKSVLPDSMAILKDFLMPNIYQEMIAGDLLELSIRATPVCSAFYRISGLTEWTPMFESPEIVSAPGSETVFGSENQRDSLIGSGIYRASLYMPSDTAVDSAQILYKISKTFYDSVGSITDTIIIEDTACGRISLKEYGYPQIVELKDSAQTIRHGPRKGYLSIFQPKGVRFVTDGRYNNYVRLNLAPAQPSWIPDTSLIYLPPGTPVPYSEVKYIRTFAMEEKSRVSVYLTETLPYRVEADPESGRISLFIYYAMSDTDWIRYDSGDDLIKYITWSQPQEGVYRLDIQLSQKQIWGYDVNYVDNVLNLDIKKSPSERIKLKDLKIVIDPGHSSDPGSIGPTGLTEAEANLAIASRLAQILMDKGADVAMTRRGNENVDLNDRPRIALKENCDIFISVHNNALPDGVNPFENHGVSTYYYHLHSKPLAEAIQKSMVDKLKMGDFGKYYANFAVTRPTQYLAVLVECTFMILPEEEEKLRGREFPKECAEAIARGIENFLRDPD